MTSSLLLTLLALLLILAQPQSNYCGSCQQDIRPVCINGVRYLNECLFTCNHQSGSVACTDPRIMNTVTHSGKTCYCPLISQYTCVVKKASGTFLNPCFAQCELPNTGYGDYKKCDGPRNLVSSNLYRVNVSCNCNSTYVPVCINGVEFSNSCYAACYQPNTATSTCPSSYNFVTSPQNQANCVCIYSVNPVCVSGKRFANACLAACDYPNGPFLPC